LANVGALQVRPGVVNAVPGEVALSLEIRAPSDDVRTGAGDALTKTAREIATRRGLRLEIKRSYTQPATPCAQEMIERLSRAAAACNPAGAPLLASGATHDTSAMADVCPVGMLFTGCRNGISHHPDEFVHPEAMSAGVLVLARFLQQVADTVPAAD
jgi:allantoate deiminase